MALLALGWVMSRWRHKKPRSLLDNAPLVKSELTVQVTYFTAHTHTRHSPKPQEIQQKHRKLTLAWAGSRRSPPFIARLIGATWRLHALSTTLVHQFRQISSLPRAGKMNLLAAHKAGHESWRTIIKLPFFQALSIKTRVTLGTLGIFLLSMWTLTFFASLILHEDMQRISGDQQFSTASFIAADINHELEDHIRALESVAQSISPAMLGNRAALQAFLEQSQVFQNQFNAGTFVTGLDGTAIADVPLWTGRSGVNYMEKDYIVAALKDGTWTIGKPVIGKKLQAPVFAMAVPIRDPQGKIIGVLVGVTDLDQPNFLGGISQGHYGKTGSLLIVAPQYRLIITSSDKRRVVEELPAPGVNPMIDRVIDGYESSAVGVDPWGEEVLASGKRIPVAGWIMVAALPTREAFAPIYTVQRRLLLGTILFTLLAVSLIYWLTTRMMRRQLAPMLAATRALATLPDANHTPQRLPVTSQDEIGELIAGFNRLLETLAQREETLHESEGRYRTLVEWTPEPVGVHRGGKLLYVNPAAIEMIGEKSTQNLIGKPILELVHPDFHQIVLARMREQIQDGVNQPMIEEKFLTLDGTPIDVEVQATSIIYDGEPAVLVAMRDITARKLAEQALHKSEHGYRTMFDSAPEGVWMIGPDRRTTQMNQKMCNLLGYACADLLGCNPVELADEENGKIFQENALIVPNRQTRIYEVALRHRDGHNIPTEFSATNLFNEDGSVMGVLAFVVDLTERKKAESQIQSLAFSDPLTGLPNRRLLMDRLDQALTAGARHQRQGALLYIDLDDFKTLNETLGHEQGDLLLQQVAKRLLTCVREGDTVARLGGDEFVVLLEDLRKNLPEAATQAEAVGKKIIVALNQPYQLGNHVQHSTSSIGITLFGGAQQENIEEPLKRAELAMYQAKAAGHNTQRFFEEQMQAAVAARAALEAGLREAVLKNQFLLHYQAQVTDQGQITGVEALVRWLDPKRGMVSPAEFIPLAEATGLILPLGEWVLEAACKQLALWASQPEMEHLTMAVNVSARQFHHKDFVDQVLAILDFTGANPQRLKLELTESLLVSNIEDVIAKMSALKGKGVGFSLDDFGTGYSSLSYLKRLPLDQLKIDISFVRDILIDANDAAIAKTIIDLAENLGLAVIAEGVEVAGQRDLLARQGCHSYQGYLFSRPLPIEEFEAFLRRG
jgi:diguanylate cyclase (GGDEF)-like protein/PAS domain S-box-containing protein